MIRSFRDAEAKAIFNRRFSRRLPNDIQAVALRRLRMLANAHDVTDLRSPPGNRLERLAGDAYDVEICDWLPKAIQRTGRRRSTAHYH